MASSTNIRGLDHSLRKLREINPKLEREAKKRLKDDVKPIVSDAKALIPSSAPLSRWVAPKGGGVQASGVQRYNKRGSSQSIPVWSSGPARRRIGSSVARKSRRGYSGRMLLISVRQKDAAGEVFDKAGLKTNSVFTRNLSSKWGSPWRAMYRSADKHMDTVHDSIRHSVREVERQINAELRRGF